VSVEGDESADDLPPVHDRRSDSVVDEREHFGRAVHRYHLELLFMCRFSRDNNTDSNRYALSRLSRQLQNSSFLRRVISRFPILLLSSIYTTHERQNTHRNFKSLLNNKKGFCYFSLPCTEDVVKNALSVARNKSNV